MKKLISLLLVTNISSANLMEDIKSHDIVNVGVSSDKPPFGYIENGNLKGFDIELAKIMTRNLLGDEKKVKFIPLDASDRIPALLSNQVDLIIANLTQTDLREKTVNFAEPYG